MKICRPFDINIYKLFAELFFGFAVGCFFFFSFSVSASSQKTVLFCMGLKSCYCVAKLKYFLQVRGKNLCGGSEVGEYLQMH